jgi:5-methylcytosine-specific restriction endonuclease McrA
MQPYVGVRSRMKLHWATILVKQRIGKEQREDTGMLRRAMIESGILHQCANCGCPPVWMGKPLVLEIDHISGDWSDNERSNVRFLCPNCHSQTPNYGSRSRGKLYEEDIDEIQTWGDTCDVELEDADIYHEYAM